MLPTEKQINYAFLIWTKNDFAHTQLCVILKSRYRPCREVHSTRGAKGKE